MNRQEIEDKAFEYHDSGLHCAEAVFRAVGEAYSDGFNQDLIRMATAFGAGLGRTHKEACGALIGGVMVLGLLYGRSEAGADWGRAAELAADLRQRFLEEYGTTACAVLLLDFHPQENMTRCKRVSGRVAGLVSDLIGGTL